MCFKVSRASNSPPAQPAGSGYVPLGYAPAPPAHPAPSRFVPLVLQVDCYGKTGFWHRSNSERSRPSCKLVSGIGVWNGNDIYDHTGKIIAASYKRVAAATAIFCRSSTLRETLCDESMHFKVRVRCADYSKVVQNISASFAKRKREVAIPRGSMLSLLVCPESSLADIMLVGIFPNSSEGPSDPVLAHRVILSSESTVFKTMLSGNFKESGAVEIRLEDISSNALAMVVRYLYGAQLETLHIPPGDSDPDIPSWQEDLSLFM